MQFHTKNIDESFNALSTDTSGLSSDEVATRQKEYGLNILPSEPEIGRASCRERV